MRPRPVWSLRVGTGLVVADERVVQSSSGSPLITPDRIPGRTPAKLLRRLSAKSMPPTRLKAESKNSAIFNIIRQARLTNKLRRAKPQADGLGKIVRVEGSNVLHTLLITHLSG